MFQLAVQITVNDETMSRESGEQKVSCVDPSLTKINSVIFSVSEVSMKSDSRPCTRAVEVGPSGGNRSVGRSTSPRDDRDVNGQTRGPLRKL